jgi:hypothetical protein
MKPFIYMGYGINKLIFGITGTEEPKFIFPVCHRIDISKWLTKEIPCVYYK